MRYVIFYAWKVAYMVFAALLAVALAEYLGIVLGLCVYAAFFAACCLTAARMLHHSVPGQVTWRNRFAGLFLPMGFRLTRGRPVPLTIVAWVNWCLIGAAGVFLFHRGSAAMTNHPVLAVGLFAMWLLYGALTQHQLGLTIHEFRNSPRPRRTTATTSLLMIGFVGASAALWVMGKWTLAMLAVALPVGIVFVPYGLFIGVMLVFGRHARWN